MSKPSEKPIAPPAPCFANRELSWLKFNQRVLEEACAPENPLAEQLSFAAIFQSNLDEFFMVRVGTLYDQLGTAIRENKTNMTAREQLDAVLSAVKPLLKRKDAIYTSLMQQLRPHGFDLCSFDRLTDKERRSLERYFCSDVLPLLAPQIVGPKQPFPFLQNQHIYVVVTLRTKSDNLRVGIIPCTTGVLRRLLPIPGSTTRFVLMEDLILHFAPLAFAYYKVVSKNLIRVVRNADISVDDMVLDAEAKGKKKDYRKTMEKMLRMRRRLSPIKLDYKGNMDSDVMETLCKYLDLPKKQTFRSTAPLDLSFLFMVQDALHGQKELFFPRRVPQRSAELDDTKPIIPQIARKDRLLSYPYEEMRPFLQLLEEAGRDPAVTSIRMTLYRVAHNSLVVEALSRAAENGKEVLVLVELRARFDEENNLDCSHVLENAGCRIIYGLDGMKTHSKLCLITRKTDEGIQYITQIGTGNYSEKTAKLYTDLCLMTADPDIGREAAEVFTCLAEAQIIEHTEHLLVAPHCLQNRLIDHIQEQINLAAAGQPAYVGVKCNSLTDKVLINKLIEASRAGVKVEMIIRGISCLIAGVEGYTENVEIRSIVGRYLEHSRIYIFGSPAVRQEVYISSADFMTRNTTRRVEVAVPLYDPDIKARVLESFRTMWNDNVKVRVQQRDGNYRHKEVAEGEALLNAQEAFFEQAYLAAGTPLPTNQPVIPAPVPVEEPVAEEGEEHEDEIEVVPEDPLTLMLRMAGVIEEEGETVPEEAAENEVKPVSEPVEEQQPVEEAVPVAAEAPAEELQPEAEPVVEEQPAVEVKPVAEQKPVEEVQPVAEQKSVEQPAPAAKPTPAAKTAPAKPADKKANPLSRLLARFLK